MSEKIKLVQGDTAPQVMVVVKDESTGEVVDISNSTVLVKFRQFGNDTLKATIQCHLLPGLIDAQGNVSIEPPYNTPGAGGRFVIIWPEGALDTAGIFEGEIEITYPDGRIQTVYGLLKFVVRAQF